MKRKEVCFTGSVLIHEFQANEIMKIIGKTVYDAVKKQDKHPFFATVRVAEEGESRGEMEVRPGVWENTVKLWPAHIIKQVAEALKPVGGIFKKIWDGHTAKTDKLGNFSVQHGDVLGAHTFQDGGKQVTDAVVYVQPGTVRTMVKKKQRDVASIQGFVQFVKTASGWVAERVDTLIGIALASSKWNSPGFSGARILAMVQEFENESDEDREAREAQEEIDRKTREKKKRGKGRMEFDRVEVKVWIGQQGIKPEDLFGSEGLAKSPVVEGVVKSAVENAVADAVAEQKKTVDALENDKKGLEDSIKAKDTEMDTIKSDLGEFRTTKNRAALTVVIKESDALKDATEKEVDYIAEQLDPTIMDVEDLKERGKQIEAGIAKAKEDIGRLGINFNSTTTPPVTPGEGDPPVPAEGDAPINALTGDKMSRTGEGEVL